MRSRGGLEVRAAESFRFIDYEELVMPTGHRASNLREFLEHLRKVPVGVIEHHLHRAILRHRFGEWDYPNDFARWAARVLEDHALAEKLAALDPFSSQDLEEAREVIVDLVEEHLDALHHVPWARRGFEFDFSDGIELAIPGEREVWSIAAMRAAVAEIPHNSIYYHFHAARLRGPGDDSDDFSRWIEGQFGPHPIVDGLKRIDFYFFSLEDLRGHILAIFDAAPRQVSR
jgi:hypothetical protein